MPEAAGTESDAPKTGSEVGTPIATEVANPSPAVSPTPLEKWFWGFVLLAVVGLRWVVGRLGMAVFLAAAVATAHLALRLLPAYWSYFALKDEMVRIARSPQHDDGIVLLGLMHAVRQQGLEVYVREDDFRIVTLEGSRRITCEYRMPVELLPGRTEWIHFRIHVEEPFFAEPAPVFISWHAGSRLGGPWVRGTPPTGGPTGSPSP